MRTSGYNIDIRIDNVTVCYDDIGEGNIPVILIHGFPFNKSMWKPQLDFLKSFFRVIAFDIRGFGKTTSGTEEFTIQLFADDLIKLLDALQIAKAVICGLSMGGYIALNAMNRYPERFHAIVLSDTQCTADSPEGKEKRYKTIEHIRTSGLNEFADAFVKNIFCKESFTSKKDEVDTIKQMVLATSPGSVMRTLAALAERSETCSTLDSITIPALVMCGKEDAVTPAVQSEFLQRNIKNAELKIIDQAGHMSNIEQKDEFNNHLKSFLSKL